MICEKCGAQLRSIDKFCRTCGESVLNKGNDIVSEEIHINDSNDLKSDFADMKRNMLRLFDLQEKLDKAENDKKILDAKIMDEASLGKIATAIFIIGAIMALLLFLETR